MPFRRSAVSLIVAAGIFSLAITADAQDAPPLWVQSVTVDAAAGTATITGTGFSHTCAVTLDGHALTVLPEGTAGRLVVVVPAMLLATPGTYRLSMTDAVRQVGDAFEVTIADRPELTLTAGEGSAPGARQTPAVPAVGAPLFVAPGEVVGTRLIENISNSAFGVGALDNSSGSANTAGGYSALTNNTSGQSNTAAGAHASYSNTTGFANTAVGFQALYNNVSGDYNTALGYVAGGSTSGNYNIMIGTFVSGGAESNTLRLGRPYDGSGINRTFVAGIRGTRVTGATPVGVTASGQLGMADVLGAGLDYGCFGCSHAGTLELYNRSSGDTTLQSGEVFRLLLNPRGGNIGVGASSQVGAGVGFGCPSCYQNGYLELYNPGTGNLTLQGGTAFDLLLNPYGGNVGIGTTNAQHPLHLGNGAHVTAGGVWTNASSRTVKEHITPLTLERAQEALLALAPVEYTYKADPTQHQVGFIAEDVPALVAQNDRASLSPMDLVAVLTKVVQAQQAQLAAQQIRQAEQDRAIAALQAELARPGGTR